MEIKNEISILLIPLFTGIFLGLIFYGGLWLTVKKGLTSKFSALWFMGSMLLRTGITLLGFYFISAGHWERLLLSLLGFTIVRFSASWSARNQEVTHAPKS